MDFRPFHIKFITSWPAFLKVVLVFPIVFLTCCRGKPSTEHDPVLILHDTMYTDCPPAKKTLALLQKRLARVKLDSLSFSKYMAYQTWGEPGNELLYCLNNQNHAIDILDLSGNLPPKHIFFKKEGPDGIEEDPDGFYFTGNGFYLVHDGAKTLYHTDMNGHVLERHVFAGSELDAMNRGGGFGIFAAPEFATDLYVQQSGGHAFLPIYPQIDVEDIRFYEYPLFLKYDLLERNAVYSTGRYPKKYRGTRYFGAYHEASLLYVDSTVIMSFPASPEIFVYSLTDGHLLNKKCGESSLFPIDQPPGLERFSSTVQEQSNHFTEHAWYLKMLHDPHRQMFYRFCKLPQELYAHDGKLNSRVYGPWSVILFDSHFNKLGETEFQPGSLFVYYAFVTSEGLWISAAAQENEDEALFYVFDIKT